MELVAGVGLLLTAGILGITHGIEPDHVSGIAALTHEAGDPKLSALVGACFAGGHAALVVLWICLAYLLLGTTSFPSVFKQFGLLAVGIILSLLGLYLGITGTRKFIHQHDHDHGDGPHAHYHVHMPATITPDATSDGHSEHKHGHSVVEYFKIGTIGALFTLSPPISMIAFISVTVTENSRLFLIAAVTAYTVAIVTTMAGIGGGAGLLFRLSKERGERIHALSQIVASVLILVVALNLLIGVVPNLIT